MEVGVECYWYLLDINGILALQYMCVRSALAFPFLVDLVLK